MARQAAVFVCFEYFQHAAFVDIRVFKQAKFEFFLQMAAHGKIDGFQADFPGLQGGFDRLTIAGDGRQFDIDARFQGQAGGCRLVGRQIVVIMEHNHSLIIGHHQPVETEFFTQQSG